MAVLRLTQCWAPLDLETGLAELVNTFVALKLEVMSDLHLVIGNPLN